MEKGQTYVIAAAIIAAGLIIAAAILAVGRANQVGRFAFAEGTNAVVIDTQTGNVGEGAVGGGWGMEPIALFREVSA